MGIIGSTSSVENQTRRVLIKNLDQQMKQAAITGAGLNGWEAEELIRIVQEVYFSHPELVEFSPGQLEYQCVSAKEGPGKPLKECSIVSVILTLFDDKDLKELPLDGDKSRQQTIRQRRMQRIAVEAKDQGGLLSQEDLSLLLMCDVKTIQRDVAALRKRGVTLPTRGQQKDIGPGVTHREWVVRLWLEGKEPVEIARATHHSIGAVENYLQKYQRVAYLVRKDFTPHEIALTAGISCRAAEVFSALDKKSRHMPFYQSRLEEIMLVGGQYYLAEGEKKDLLPLKASRKG
jgi:biotin operon repressor